VGFQLKPDGLTGKSLLGHMFAKQQISYTTNMKALYKPNEYLDIAIKNSLLQ
jgi:hypothetical protein